MRKTNRLALAAALLAFAQLPHAGQAARDDLPTLFDEDTLLYFEIPSVPQLQEDWRENPFYELYQREDVRTFVDALIAAFREENFKGLEEGFDENDEVILEGLLSGQIAFGISRFDVLSFLPTPGAREGVTPPETAPPNFWLVFDFEDEGLKEKLIADMEEEEDEFIEYEDFYIILDEGISVAYNDDIAAVTNNEENAIKFIDRYLEKDSQSSLADSDAFQLSFSEFYDNSSLYLFVDLSIIADTAERAAARYEGMTTQMVAQGQLAPPETVLSALGLNTFRSFSVSADADPSELKARMQLHLEPNEGFFGKFFSHYGDSLPDISFLGEDLRQASASSFDISGMLHDLEQTIAIISPFAGQLYFGQKAQMGQALSVPADNALINNFSGSIYVAAGETPNTSAAELADNMPGMGSYLDQGSTIILGINNRLAFEAFVDGVLNSFNQSGFIEKQDYLGLSQYLIKKPTPGPGPAIFVSDQHLLFEQSNPDFAKLVVSMMQDPRNPLFEKRDVQDALADLPPNPVSITYNDAEKLLQFFSKFFKDMTEEIGKLKPDENEEEADNPLANLEIPVIEDFGYFTLGSAYKENDGIYQEVIMRPKN